MRQEAIKHRHVRGTGQTMATVYVGDQLARIADVLEANQKTPAPDVYFEAIEVPHGDGGLSDPDWVPGSLVIGRRQ